MWQLEFWVGAVTKYCASCLVMLLLACAGEPSSDTRYVVTNNDAGAVAIIFAEPRENGQYCVYRKEFAVGAKVSVGILNMEESGDAQLLTSHTIAADDLRRAVQAESAYTSYKFSAMAYAMFPTATLCLASFATWVASRHPALKRATVLTCAAGASLIGAVFATESQGTAEATAATNAVLSPEMHRADENLPRVEKVLGWLATENSLPCEEETENNS